MSEVTYIVEDLIYKSLLAHGCVLESQTDYYGYVVIEEIGANSDNRDVLNPIQSLKNVSSNKMNKEELHHNCLKEISSILKKYNCILIAEDDGCYLEPVKDDYVPYLLFESSFDKVVILKNGQLNS